MMSYLYGTNVRFPDLTTSGSAANCRISTSLKEIWEVTSMSAFKREQR
jgi:hypothetical protein